MVDGFSECFCGDEFLGPCAAGDDADGCTMEGFLGFGDGFWAGGEGCGFIGTETDELGEFVHALEFGEVGGVGEFVSEEEPASLGAFADTFGDFCEFTE